MLSLRPAALARPARPARLAHTRCVVSRVADVTVRVCVNWARGACGDKEEQMQSVCSLFSSDAALATQSAPALAPCVSLLHSLLHSAR